MRSRPTTDTGMDVERWLVAPKLNFGSVYDVSPNRPPLYTVQGICLWPLWNKSFEFGDVCSSITWPEMSTCNGAMTTGTRQSETATTAPYLITGKYHDDQLSKGTCRTLQRYRKNSFPKLQGDLFPKGTGRSPQGTGRTPQRYSGNSSPKVQLGCEELSQRYRENPPKVQREPFPKGVGKTAERYSSPKLLVELFPKIQWESKVHKELEDGTEVAVIHLLITVPIFCV